MGNTSLVLFGGRTEYPAVQEYSGTVGPGLPDQVSVIYIEIASQAYESMLVLFHKWFRGRDDAYIVDDGTTDKQDICFIVMEWFEQEPDRLFVDILNSEDLVSDYVIYTRQVDE